MEKSIDERLEYLLQSSESLHSTVGELTANVQKLTDTVQKRTEQEDERWKRVRRAFLAAATILGGELPGQVE